MTTERFFFHFGIKKEWKLTAFYFIMNYKRKINEKFKRKTVVLCKWKMLREWKLLKQNFKIFARQNKNQDNAILFEVVEKNYNNNSYVN